MGRVRANITLQLSPTGGSLVTVTDGPLSHRLMVDAIFVGQLGQRLITASDVLDTVTGVIAANRVTHSEPNITEVGAL